MPPLIEYLDALLTGTGRDLDLQTFKLTDQLTGRLMGARADMTPQAARIDAHYLKRECPVRLCYAGSVLRTRPDAFAGSRELLQAGAELFGHPGPESDVELIRLMLAALDLTGVHDLHLDLGHVGVFRGLTTAAQLPEFLLLRGGGGGRCHRGRRAGAQRRQYQQREEDEPRQNQSGACPSFPAAAAGPSF